LLPKLLTRCTKLKEPWPLPLMIRGFDPNSL